MKILLVNPSWGSRVQAQRYNRRWPPLDLLNTAAILRKERLSVSLCDARATGASPSSLPGLAADADFVLVTSSPLDRWQCPNLDLAPLLAWTRAVPSEKLILSGVHGTAFPKQILEATGARIVMRGEPEASVLPLFQALSRGAGLDAAPSLSFIDSSRRFVHTEDAPPADLTAMPPPAYDLAPPSHYEYELLGRKLAVLETSRGCPHRCLYCMKTMYGNKVRTKSPGQVSAEMEQAALRGYRFVYFIDLEFSLDHARTLELCGVLRSFPLKWCCQTRLDSVDPELLREMKAAGCALIHYGIESGSEEVRQRIAKPIPGPRIEQAVAWTKAAGIAVAGFFLTGFPFDTDSSWRQTEKLARKLNLTYASFHLPTPYAGTGLAPPQAGPQTPWWEAPRPGPRERARLRNLYLRYYLRPRYLIEILRSRALSGAAARLFANVLRSLSTKRSSEPAPPPRPPSSRTAPDVQS